MTVQTFPFRDRISSVKLNGDTFTLTDKYTDSTGVGPQDTTYKFRIEQDKLGWGYPYRYQVFPVTESSPSFSRSENLNQCTVGSVTYQDADKNYDVGSAIGYGLDVKATKAESADTVTVTWTKPYLEDNTKLAPVVYRKASSDPSGKWEAITPSITNTKATVSIASEKTDTKHKAFDYIVKYEEQSSFEGNPHPYYVESLQGDGQEAANKGYYFTILGADASKREIAGNAEELTVTAYDWKERKNGPEAYKVYIKNNNIDGEWHLVATVPVTDKGYGAITEENDTGITVSNPAGTILRFTPEFTDDVHTKYLKVLRDYKHYYKIEAVRTIKDSDGVETEITAVLGDDDSIWGARQITAKEFAVISGMSIGTSLYNDTYSQKDDYGTWSNDKLFRFKTPGPYIYDIQGELYACANLVSQYPFYYGALKPNGKFSDPQSKPCTLTLKFRYSDILMDYSGTVTIDTMDRNSGTYIINYNNQTGDFRSDVSGYFTYN